MGTVLIVDDEPAIRSLLQLALAGAGHRVLTSDTGAAALEHVATEHVDAVLVDLQLDGECGLDVIALLRARQPDLASIVITGREQSILDDQVRVLHKPFSVGAARSAVDAALAR